MATPQQPQTPQTPGVHQQPAIDSLKPVVVSTTKSLDAKRARESTIQVKYFGSVNMANPKQVTLSRPCVISSSGEEVFRLLTEAFGFKQDYEIVVKGWQYKKKLVKLNKNWFIKIRLLKLYKMSVPGMFDKVEPQTTSSLVEASLVCPHSGNKDNEEAASKILKGFSDQLKPLCNLEK